MADFESVLKQYLMRASSHSKNVYGKNPLTAQEIFDLANSKEASAVAATIKPDGQPHLSPTDIVAVDGKLYLGVDKTTARYRNLQKNPRLMIDDHGGAEAPSDHRREDTIPRDGKHNCEESRGDSE